MVLLIAAAALALGACNGTPVSSGDADTGSLEWQTLAIGDGKGWSFLGKPWRDGDGGLIHPTPTWITGANAYDGQNGKNDDTLKAFHLGAAYGDFELECRFQWNGGHCGAGIIFGAQDHRNYYMLHFPNIGQCSRAEHFWAMVSKVEDGEWVKVLKMQMLHGVASERTVWHQARLVVKGNTIRAWVDGRPTDTVVDDTLPEAGFVGLEAWAYGGAASTFQNMRVRGAQVETDWDATVTPAKNWFLPYPARSAQQTCSGITRAPNGDLLMALSPPRLVRSTDNARTWAPVEGNNFPGGWINTTHDGRLICLSNRDQDTVMAESEDNGKTWSEPAKVERAPFTPPENLQDMKLGGLQGFMELADGTLLAFQVGTVPGRGHGHGTGFNIWEWGMWANCAYSIRSTDGGKTWSAPVPLNGSPAIGQKYDLCEVTSNVQTKEGKVLSLVRPIYSPWMWEIWSENNGESWGPATSGPFPCYAATALATEDGTLLVSGRMPGLGLYVSHDSGMTWQPYRVDTGGLWGMGRMYEVEPGLVFYIYMDHYASDMRAQFIRITEDGAVAAPEALP